MSSAFKWIVLKASTIIARNVSSLFYQLLYREMFRQINDITHDGEKTTDIAYQIGYLAAQESAERQMAIFRLFPSKADKILEYLPLLWELYNGVPMENYTIEWDRSDSLRPIIKYVMKDDPLSYGIGSDIDRDRLPWKEFWSNKCGYGAMISGLLTQVASYILKIKSEPVGIIVKNSENPLQGGKNFTLHCQIVPKEEVPEYTMVGFSGAEILPETGGDETNQEPEGEPKRNIGQDMWIKITDKITIDKLEDLFSTPTGYLRILLRNIIEKFLHMEPLEAFDHFVNYERDFLRIIGFLSTHIVNELGQLPQKIFSNAQVARVYGQLFLFIKENTKKFVSLPVIGGLRDYIISAIEGLAPTQFVTTVRQIPPQELILLVFEGAEKALKDLGVPFNDLKGSLFEELRNLSATVSSQKEEGGEPESTTPSQISTNQTDDKGFGQSKKDERDQQIGRLFEEFIIVSTAILSMPAQLMINLVYNTFTGINEIISAVFNTVRQSSQNIVDLLQQMRE